MVWEMLSDSLDCVWFSIIQGVVYVGNKHFNLNCIVADSCSALQGICVIYLNFKI